MILTAQLPPSWLGRGQYGGAGHGKNGGNLRASNRHAAGSSSAIALNLRGLYRW